MDVGHGHSVGRASGLPNPSSTPGSYRIASNAPAPVNLRPHPRPPKADKVRRVPWRWRRRRHQTSDDDDGDISMTTRSTCSVLPARGRPSITSYHCISIRIFHVSCSAFLSPYRKDGGGVARGRCVSLPSDETDVYRTVP